MKLYWMVETLQTQHPLNFAPIEPSDRLIAPSKVQ